MRAAHAAAAAGIFGRRNPGAAAAAGGASGGGGGGGGGVPTVDLHGLHVSEALEQLEGVLLGLLGPAGSGRAGAGGSSRQAGRPLLRVVVGEGQHGRVPSRLPAAVRQYLAGQGLRVSERYAGLLEVALPP